MQLLDNFLKGTDKINIDKMLQGPQTTESKDECASEDEGDASDDYDADKPRPKKKANKGSANKGKNGKKKKDKK